MSYRRPNMVLYVTLRPRDVSYRRPEDVSLKRPEDVLKTSYIVLQVMLRNVQEIRTSVSGLSINKCYITKMASTEQKVDDTYRVNMDYLSNWITRGIFIFHKKMLSNSMFHQFNKFLKSKLPNFRAKLTIRWAKKFLSSAKTKNNVNLACFIAITTHSFLNNWKWETLYEEQNIRWKHYIYVLKLLKVGNATKDHYLLHAYCIFILKIEFI